MQKRLHVRRLDGQRQSSQRCSAALANAEGGDCAREVKPSDGVADSETGEGLMEDHCEWSERKLGLLWRKYLREARIHCHFQE